MSEIVDRKTEKTPPQLRAQRSRLEAAMHGEVEPSTHTSPQDLEEIITPEPLYPDTDPPLEDSPVLPKAAKKPTTSPKQAADFYFSSLKSETVVLITDLIDLPINARLVTIGESLIWFLSDVHHKELRLKFSAKYRLVYQGVEYSVVFSGGLLHHPELPFTILSFILIDD